MSHSVILQTGTEGRSSIPCRPGFSEDVYDAPMPETLLEGQPLLTGKKKQQIIKHTKACCGLKAMVVCVFLKCMCG